MEMRHRARLNSAFEAISHHQLVSGTELLHEKIEIGEVITTVCVAHDDETTARGINSRPQSGAVTFFGNSDYTGTCRPCNLLRAITRTVVGNDNLSVNPQAMQTTDSRFNASLDRG